MVFPQAVTIGKTDECEVSGFPIYTMLTWNRNCYFMDLVSYHASSSDPSRYGNEMKTHFFKNI
ncbi:hypothetical protein BPY_22470 [Bifidobacterium psychraerophilum]